MELRIQKTLKTLAGCGDEIGEFTEDIQKEYWDHFCKVGNKPYRSGWGSSLNKEGLSRECDFCRLPMVQNGFGKDYGGFYCSGCSLKEETRDGGKTWTESKKD